MSNKDLFKQAIAEAKTIREAAITNAKEALEESLTPHLKEMLAQKLQEMDRDEEDEDENVKNENIYEAEEEEVETEEGEEVEGEEAEEEGNEDEELDFDKMSKEEFTELVLQIVHQDEEENSSEEEVPGEEAPEGEDMTGMDSEEEEEININELLEELQGMDSQTVNENLKAAIGTLSAKYGKAFNDWYDKVANAEPLFSDEPLEKFSKKFMKTMSGDEEGYGLNKPAKGVGMEEGADDLNENLKAAIGTLSAKYGKAFNDWYDKVANAEPLFSDEPLEKFSKKFMKTMSGDEEGYGLNKVKKEEVDEELEEALNTIEELRTQLQEVNLLNAKLLYVNKVFKANNLTESQKVNVVAAFDKAETVKEVKLVFETVSKNVVTKSATIREHKSFASSAAGTAATAGKKEIISEVSEQVARWQKLAGIIK